MIDQLNLFFSEHPYGILFLVCITIIGFCIGLFALIIQVLSYRKQKQSEKDEKDIRQILRTNLSSKKEEIDKVEQEISRLVNDKTQLNEELKNSIPSKAKLLFLKDQLELSKENIINNYKAYNDVRSKIESIESNIPESLKLDSEIIQFIDPIYAKKQRQQKLNRYTSIAIIAMLTLLVYPFIFYILGSEITIQGFINDKPLFRVIEAVLLTFLAFRSLLYLKKNKLEYFELNKILRFIVTTISIIGMILGILLVTFLIEQTEYYNSYDPIDEIIMKEFFFAIGLIVIGAIISQGIMKIINEIKKIRAST